MADSYQVLGTVETVELVGATTRPVHQVTATAIPSGAVFSVVVGNVDFAAEPLGLILHDTAGYLNHAANVPGVADVTLYQDVNASGQFVYKVNVTIESTSGNSSVTRTIAYTTLFEPAFTKYVNGQRANLDAIEEL